MDLHFSSFSPSPNSWSPPTAMLLKYSEGLDVSLFYSFNGDDNCEGFSLLRHKVGKQTGKETMKLKQYSEYKYTRG